MNPKEKVTALIGAYIELAQAHSYDDSQIIDALTDIFDEEELEELVFGSFVEEYFHDGEMKRSQAETLPEGWVWKDFVDGSGSLQGPGGERFFMYSLPPIVPPDGPEVEYRARQHDTHCTFYGALTDFKDYAEKCVSARLLRNSLTDKISAAQQKAASADMSAERPAKEPEREP